jgi:hypothetical protein
VKSKIYALGQFWPQRFGQVCSGDVRPCIRLALAASRPIQGAGRDYMPRARTLLSKTVHPANVAVNLPINVPIAIGRSFTVPFTIPVALRGGSPTFHLSSLKWLPLTTDLTFTLISTMAKCQRMTPLSISQKKCTKVQTRSRSKNNDFLM